MVDLTSFRPWWEARQIYSLPQPRSPQKIVSYREFYPKMAGQGLIVTIVSRLGVFYLFTGRIQPTYIGVKYRQDIPVYLFGLAAFFQRCWVIRRTAASGTRTEFSGVELSGVFFSFLKAYPPWNEHFHTQTWMVGIRSFPFGWPTFRRCEGDMLVLGRVTTAEHLLVGRRSFPFESQSPF